MDECIDLACNMDDVRCSEIMVIVTVLSCAGNTGGHFKIAALH